MKSIEKINIKIIIYTLGIITKLKVINIIYFFSQDNRFMQVE